MLSNRDPVGTALIDARDADGAERHWRTHLEVIGRRLLRDDTGAKAVVDLFG